MRRDMQRLIRLGAFGAALCLLAACTRPSLRPESLPANTASSSSFPSSSPSSPAPPTAPSYVSPGSSRGTSRSDYVTPPTTSPSVSSPDIRVQATSFAPSSSGMQALRQAVESFPAERPKAFLLESTDGAVSIGYNTQARFFGASTVKLALALYLYTRSLQEPELLAQTTEGLTVAQHIEEMLHRSSNASYHALRTKFSPTDGFNAFVRAIGCPSFQIGANHWAYITAEEGVRLMKQCAAFFTKGETGRLFEDQLRHALYNSVASALQNEGKAYDCLHKYGYTEKIAAEIALVNRTDGASYYLTVLYDLGGSLDNWSQFTAAVTPALDAIMDEYAHTAASSTTGDATHDTCAASPARSRHNTAARFNQSGTIPVFPASE